MAKAMVMTVRPKARATPRNPIPRPGNAAARTALPVELLPDPWFQQDCRGGFRDLPLDLAGRVLHFGAVPGQRLQLIVGVGHGRLGQRGFQQALRDQIGKAAIRGGGVSIVLDGQPEVAARRGLPGARPRIRRSPAV